MSYKINNATKKQRSDFIVKYNHQQGLRIEEGEDGSLYALESWEVLEGDKVVSKLVEYEAEQKAKEKERISMLSLTAADVERAIYKAKGMDFEDILELVSNLVDTPSQPSPLGEGGASEIDVKALKIELKANNFYRGNPYVDLVGGLLGYSSDDLDYLFEHGELPKKNEESKVAEEDI